MTNLDGLRILVVDDEPFVRSTVKTMLRIIGHFTIAEAADGEQALAKVRQFRPDLVLCDVNMAPVGGLEFVERLRNDRDDAKQLTKVVMLTVAAEEPTVLDAARLKVDGYLVKPVSPKQLQERLRALFRDRRSA